MKESLASRNTSSCPSSEEWMNILARWNNDKKHIDWRELPDGILLQHVIFSCVCKSWRSLSPMALLRHSEGNLPWLILPYDYDPKPKPKPASWRPEYNYCCDGLLGFFSILDETTYLLEIPELYGRRICGSSFGWLITVHSNSEVQLLHPFSRKVVYLPPLTEFPYVLGTQQISEQNGGILFYGFQTLRNCTTSILNNMEWGFDHMRDLYIYKAITSPNVDIVIAIPWDRTMLLFYRPGEGKDTGVHGSPTKSLFIEPDPYLGMFVDLHGMASGDVNPMSGDNVRSRLKTMKKDWKVAKHALDASGFGLSFNQDGKKIDADDDAWASYRKAHPEARTLRQKMFPHYDQCCILFGNDVVTGEGGNNGFDEDIIVSYVDLGGVGEQTNAGGDGSQVGESSIGVGDGSQADSGVKSTTPTAKKGKKSRFFEDIPEPPSFKVFTETVVEIAKSFKAPVKLIEMPKEALKALLDMDLEIYLRSLDLMGENDKLMEIFLGQDEEVKTPWLFRKHHQVGL
ncbi:hypothetical protein IFM89_003902 [Coptis chinensis]|uniref:F-box domain-containing protein n=1 Tax=Coptis chinensis TaxID=261450 RepID=A0A835M9Q9_9MAGN|nr:hypothetical protein IFM89_003902 [Coptis chinensis]